MLEITRVRHRFSPGTPHEVLALDGVTLTIEQGAFVQVVGTNGSGKSTLLNAVAGTFIVDEGELRLDGRDITKLPEHARARSIGRVFQNPFSGTAPGMTVMENLALAAGRGNRLSLYPLTPRTLRQEIGDRVRALGMGLEDRLNNDIGTLSGGQRQALTLLMATWSRPRLLLLDEHTAALDPRSAEQVIRITRQIVSENQLTTLMVTHSMQQAVSLGDRVIMMHMGRVAHDDAGQARKRLRVDTLLDRFEALRRRDRLDEPAAEMLLRMYA